MNSVILVADDDLEVCRFTREYLEAAGYPVHVAASPYHESAPEDPDVRLIVVGMRVLRQANVALRERFAAKGSVDRRPFLVLLDSLSSQHRMIALSHGADDWVVKPFSPGELVERVRSLMRRSASNTDNPDIVIDSWAMKLSVRGLDVQATKLEFKLLEYLAGHPGRVFTRDFLLDTVWGDMRFINPRSVDACIRRIREKIEADSKRPRMLKTIRGVGYRMDATAVWQPAPTEICDCPACRTKISALRFQEAAAKRKAVLIQD
jgi:DNA-binding response OmpR family regulator